MNLPNGSFSITYPFSYLTLVGGWVIIVQEEVVP